MQVEAEVEVEETHARTERHRLQLLQSPEPLWTGDGVYKDWGHRLVFSSIFRLFLGFLAYAVLLVVPYYEKKRDAVPAEEWVVLCLQESRVQIWMICDKEWYLLVCCLDGMCIENRLDSTTRSMLRKGPVNVSIHLDNIEKQLNF